MIQLHVFARCRRSVFLCFGRAAEHTARFRYCELWETTMLSRHVQDWRIRQQRTCTKTDMCLCIVCV